MPFERDKLKSKGYLKIIEELRKELAGGRYQPGDKLPSEKELCSHFSVSRSSVREALAALTYAGVIAARSGSGYYIIGNSSAMNTNETVYCAAKLVIEIDKTWNIASIKHLLAAGVDGVIVRIDDDEHWPKQIRAIRQAANDLNVHIPLLIEITVMDSDTGETLRLAVKANADAIIIRSCCSPQAIITVRRTVEEEGSPTAIFAWIDCLEGNEVLLRAADGIIIDHILLSSAAEDSLALLLHQGMTLSKLMYLAAHPPEPGTNNTDLANIPEMLGLDGLILQPDSPGPNHLISYIPILRKALKAGENQHRERRERHPYKIIASPLANALCATAIQAVSLAKAAALVIPTENGYTPRLLSKFRPSVPLLTITSCTRTARQLKLSRGVCPLLAQRTFYQDELLEEAIRTAVHANAIQEGDIIVGVTSSADIANATNSVTLSVVGDMILRAQGVGSSIISGRIAIIKSLYNMKKNVTDKIVVIAATDASHIKLIEQAAALIVEEGGLSSHAAIACLALGKPVIVGATDATDLLLEDEQVTLDISRGMVYRGWINLG